LSSIKKKKRFIRENRGLPLARLTAQTGLTEEEVKSVLNGSETKEAPGGGPEGEVPGISHWVFCLFPCLAAFLAYLGCLQNPFVLWDDPESILNNPHIRSFDLQNLKWMFTAFYTGNWMPLTWISFALDFALGGLSPKIYHFTNLVLHVLNTGWVYFISLGILEISKTKTAGSLAAIKTAPARFVAAFSALLFGLHPIHVESVAWATERKDVLCGFFFLSALWFYLEQAQFKREGFFWKWGCFISFGLALMSKPMAVTLPLVLLILDIWPLRRSLKDLPRLAAGKLHFFVLSLLAGWTAVQAQGQINAFNLTENVSASYRLLNACHSVFFYLFKMIWPGVLVPLYPFPRSGWQTHSLEYLSALAGLFLISLLCFIFWPKRPYLFSAWLYFLITLLPVLGILQVGAQAAADRYAYLPSAGIFLLFSAWIAHLTRGRQALFLCLCLGIGLALGAKTISQESIWKDPVNFWKYTLDQYPEDAPPFVHSNLAAAYQASGQLPEALAEYEKALSFPETSASDHSGRGTVLFDLGRKEEALKELKYAVTLDPRSLKAHRNLALAYKKLGLEEDSQKELQEYLRLQQEENPAF